MAIDPGTVAEGLAAVHRRIEAAGGDIDRITVVAVTKGFGVDAARAAQQAGLADVGENYAQELVAKASRLTPDAGRPGPDAGRPSLRWHFIGAIQRNKVAALAPHVALWQTVDRPAAGSAIATRRPGAGVLVEVGTGEPGRPGCPPDGVPALVAVLSDLGLSVRGLMAVGPLGPPELARPLFRRVNQLAEALGLPERSMGMTGDLEIAVEEGSTMVRVGRALFGPRPERRGVPG